MVPFLCDRLGNAVAHDLSSIKGIIFATFWQSILVRLAVSLGVLHDGTVDSSLHDLLLTLCTEGPYTAGLLAKAIQDFLITVEMVFFAHFHRHSFSHLEYAPEIVNRDGNGTHLPFRTALRDALRADDIKEEFKHTIVGQWIHHQQEETGEAEDAASTKKEEPSSQLPQDQISSSARQDPSTYFKLEDEAEEDRPRSASPVKQSQEKASPEDASKRVSFRPISAATVEPTSVIASDEVPALRPRPLSAAATLPHDALGTSSAEGAEDLR